MGFFFLFLCVGIVIFGGLKNSKWVSSFLCGNCNFFGGFINSKWVSIFCVWEL